MIAGKRVLAIIPARGGSKGIPRKNIRDLVGKPLIAWSIEEAKKSTCIDRLILSSDDVEIIAVARQWGCDVPFVRPTEFAQDDTPGILPVLHAIETLAAQGERYDYVILLQPTSPLRRVEDIDGCLRQCLEKSAPACVSVTEAEESPYWMFQINQKGGMTPLMKTVKPILRRQDAPPVYRLNGAVYVAQCDWLLQIQSFIHPDTIAFIMPPESSLDIDREIDFILAEYTMKQTKFNS